MKNLLFAESFEQDNCPRLLCQKCGKCCKVIVSLCTYDELTILASKGVEDAKVFVNVFKKYDSIEAAKNAEPDIVDDILVNFRKLYPDFVESEISLYYCPYLSEDNKCTIYDSRPDFCKHITCDVWSLLPSDCAFYGWQFQQREKVKSFVRKLKEKLFELELLPEFSVLPDFNKTVKEAKKIIKSKIALWKKYGADNW